jgi:hypothetical protein
VNLEGESGMTWQGTGRKDKMLVVCVEEAHFSFQDYRQYCDAYHGFLTAPYEELELPVKSGLKLNYPVWPAKYNRVSAEQIGHAVASTPDRRFIRDVTVIDYAHRDQAYLRHVLNEQTATILGEATDEREIVLYRPDDPSQVIRTVHHEWWHLVHMNHPEEARILDLVGSMETPRINVPRTSYSERGAEIWSDIGQALTGDTPEVAVLSTLVNCIRVSVVAKVLAEILATVPQERMSPLHSRYKNLVQFIHREIRPQALNKLSQAEPEYHSAAQQVRASIEGSGSG